MMAEADYFKPTSLVDIISKNTRQELNGQLNLH